MTVTSEHSPKLLLSARMVGRKINPETGNRDDENSDLSAQQRLEIREDEKANCLTTVSKDSLLSMDKIYYRKLTVMECERLQTLPDGFTVGVSNSQRYKMIGNGWTVDTVAHIFSYLKPQ